MLLTYDSRHDLLYLRFDETPQAVTNQRLTDDIVLDIGENDRIVGIEIMEASTHVNLSSLLPVKYELPR